MMTKIEKHAPGTVSWFDLMTPDPEAARKFYASLFGWTYDIGGPESGGYAMCKSGDLNAAGIGKRPADAPYPSVWTVYFSVDDADATAAAIKSAGGTMMMPPMDVMDVGRMAIAIDPTGAAFGLWQPKKHIGASVRDQHGAMGWQECLTRDPDKARDFYARVFKLEPVKMEGMDYWTLNRGKDMHAGIWKMDASMPAQVPPHWQPYFVVDDTDAAVAKVSSGGGKVMKPAFDTPYGRMAVVTDPFGATFSVIKPPKR
jgi:predicted enzyme related to lactoylglutathione lyase